MSRKRPRWQKQLMQNLGVSSLRGVKGPERNRYKAMGSTTQFVDAAASKADPVKLAKHRARKLGKMGAASEVKTLDHDSPEFAEIAKRYGAEE